MTKENNQCDGCIRGLPLNDYGNHIDVAPGGIFGCTKDRYNKKNLSDTVEVSKDKTYIISHNTLKELLHLRYKYFSIRRMSLPEDKKIESLEEEYNIEEKRLNDIRIEESERKTYEKLKTKYETKSE